ELRTRGLADDLVYRGAAIGAGDDRIGESVVMARDEVTDVVGGEGFDKSVLRLLLGGQHGLFGCLEARVELHTAAVAGVRGVNDIAEEVVLVGAAQQVLVGE